jgi:hypothetical protein
LHDKLKEISILLEQNIKAIVMGDAKRRKKTLGEQYGKEEKVVSWLPLTKTQAQQAYKTTTKGAWIGIGILAFVWVTVRFIGPAFGWWQVG